MQMHQKQNKRPSLLALDPFRQPAIQMHQGREADSYDYLQQTARQTDLQKLVQKVTQQGLGDWFQAPVAHPCLPDPLRALP